MKEGEVMLAKVISFPLSDEELFEKKQNLSVI